MVSTEDRTTRERVLEDWGRYWSSHELDRLLELFTDDVVYEDVTMGAVNHGKDQLRSFGEGFFAGFPDVTFEVTSRFATDDQGGLEWVMRGTHLGNLPGMPATGKQVEVRGSSILDFAGGRIRRCSDYWDMATFLKRLGLMPAGWTVHLGFPRKAVRLAQCSGCLSGGIGQPFDGGNDGLRNREKGYARGRGCGLRFGPVSRCCSTEARSEIENGNAEKIAQAWCDAWSSHDVSRVVAVYIHDVFFEDVTFGITAQGSAELRNVAQSFFQAVPDLQLRCTRSFVDGRHGSIEWVFDGTDVGLFKTGKRFSVRGGTVVELREEKISRDSDYYDAATIMRQLGMLR